MTFAELEYDSKKRRTRREIFLEKMEGLIPWQQLEDRIEPFYAKAGRGRRPYPLGVMLRVHCVQLYNVSDPGMEDLLRGGVGAPLCGSAPERSFADETTILNFRHLLETQGMGLFEEINVHLASLGHRLTGTIVDASIIDAPSSTEPQGRTGSGDAPDEEGKPVVLRRRISGWTPRVWRTAWRRRPPTRRHAGVRAAAW